MTEISVYRDEYRVSVTAKHKSGTTVVLTELLSRNPNVQEMTKRVTSKIDAMFPKDREHSND